MEYVNILIHNKILVAGLIGWGTAQILKLIIHLAVNKKLDLERLIGDGGMPSGHSATVAAVATSTAFQCGLDSPEFAIATIVAIIVMHDAKGVRLETGKQAVILNNMVEMFEKISGQDLTPDEKLKEFVGHTPIQVYAGALLGIIVAIIFHIL